jgi:hypothetical protein
LMARISVMTSSITLGGSSASFIAVEQFLRAAHHRHAVTRCDDLRAQPLPDVWVRDVLEVPCDNEVDAINR